MPHRRVTRLESGALKPRSEVLSLATRLRKAWEALGIDEVEFNVDDDAGGWLAVADPDQLDQVLWALLDNAVKYGAGAPIAARIVADDAAGQVRLTISDRGPGVAEADRERLFTREEVASVCTSHESCAAPWMAISSSRRPSPDGGLPSRSCCLANPPTRADHVGATPHRSPAPDGVLQT
jgi:hypothetical protein